MVLLGRQRQDIHYKLKASMDCVTNSRQPHLYIDTVSQHSNHKITRKQTNKNRNKCYTKEKIKEENITYNLEAFPGDQL